MIRNIIKAALFFAVVISASSIAQVASALDLSLGDSSSQDSHNSYILAPEALPLQKSQNYDSTSTPLTKQNLNDSVTMQRRLSLEVYQGDGLDDLRRNPHQHNIVILPEEDPEAYGITLKHRF